MLLNELKPQDDLYFQGAFWIIADSFENLMKKKDISIIGEKIISDYNGTIIQQINSKRSLTHKRLWDEKYKSQLNSDKEYNYYPRGRVGIYNGLAYINIPKKCISAPHLIDMIRKYYGIEKLNYEVVPQDDDTMDNYDFLLK